MHVIAPTREPLNRCDLATHTHVWRYGSTEYGTLVCLCGRQSGVRSSDGALRVFIHVARDAA